MSVQQIETLLESKGFKLQGRQLSLQNEVRAVHFREIFDFGSDHTLAISYDAETGANVEISTATGNFDYESATTIKVADANEALASIDAVIDLAVKADLEIIEASK